MINIADLIEKFQYALDNHWGCICMQCGDLWTESKQQEVIKDFIHKYGEDWKKDANAKEDKMYKAAMIGNKWIGYNVADSSGLFVWVYKMFKESICHESDMMYRKYCSEHGQLSKGKRVDNLTLLPGTAVFCWNGRKYYHVGLYIGNETVIESASTQHGVIASNVRDTKWKYWGELKGIDYSIVPNGVNEDMAVGQKRPILRRWSIGEYVTLLQTKLVNLGYNQGRQIRHLP